MGGAAPPVRVDPPTGDPRTKLWHGVKEALLALPAHFSAPEIRIAGVPATEVYTLGAVLGATVEDQAVVTLNRMRAVWDPDDEFPLLNFVRQPQTFPDVLLRYPARGDIKLGIELKSWYLLAKEGEPTLRYKETPAVCTPWDLIVVVPWFLSDVISGTPRLLTPFIESARYVAEYRNYWWQYVRKAEGSREIITPADVTPYPQKTDHILDRPVADEGGNFGRIARAGIIDQYADDVLNELVAGIPARYWRQFFGMFKETADANGIARALERIEGKAGKGREKALRERAKLMVSRVLDLLRNNGN